MLEEVETLAPSMPGGGVALDDQRRRFVAEGYLHLESVVEPGPLAELGRELSTAFREVESSGRLFWGGGTVSGHLNCFPGASSRFVWDSLVSRGLFDVVKALSPTPLQAPNVGCNFNLPGSSQQNEHVDGYADRPFLVINVAVVETTLENGAMEILRGTHRRRYKYWELMLARPERLRVTMSPGDVLVRTSSLWHRGMPNTSASPRPMLAFTWEEGGSPLADPYVVHGGRITFLPNRFRTDWIDRMRERAFVAAPRVGTAVRMIESVFEP